MKIKISADVCATSPWQHIAWHMSHPPLGTLTLTVCQNIITAINCPINVSLDLLFQRWKSRYLLLLVPCHHGDTCHTHTKAPWHSVCTKSLNEQPLRQILSPPICLLSSYFPLEMPIEVSKITSNCLQGLLGKMLFGLLFKNLKIFIILSLTYNVTALDQVDTWHRLQSATKVKVTLPKSPSQVTWHEISKEMRTETRWLNNAKSQTAHFQLQEVSTWVLMVEHWKIVFNHWCKRV